MASVRTVARRAGCSVATVSRVLNNSPAVSAATREAVLAAMHEIGYAVAARPKSTTQSIGFAYTADRTLLDAFDAAILEGAARGCDEQGLDLCVLSIQRDKRRDETYSQFFARKGVPAAVLRTTAATRDICEAIASEGFPHVVISDRFDAPAVNYVDGDSKVESQRAVEYLIALGHRRIAFAMHNVPDRDHLDRFEAYCAALSTAGIPYAGQYVFRHPSSLAGGGTILAMMISLPERPTAIYCADPMLAIGCVKRAHELGVRIPQDFSVIGFDDTDARFGVFPTLTAVCQDATAIGFEAARFLSRRRGDESLRAILPTFFEINQSTGPAPTRAANGVKP